MTLIRFLRETRAAAGIVGVLLTMMTLGGVAFVTDHLWLTHHRDLLKNAADAAVTVTTNRLLALPESTSDDDVNSQLRALAERYVRFNLVGNVPENARARMDETLKVDVSVNRMLGTVAVSASAQMGGTLLAKEILAYAGPEDGITVKAGAEGTTGTTELVLAIDVTTSMMNNLEGNWRLDNNDPNSRIRIVKEAALELLDILASHEKSTVAVGIVPWSFRVRLNQATRTRWETKGWAAYPTERTYPHPTGGEPVEQSLPGKDRLPDACQAWKGCLDMRVVEDAFRPSFSLAPPSAEPFQMNFYTDYTRVRPELHYVSYTCHAHTTRSQHMCYDLDSAPVGANLCRQGSSTVGPSRLAPQDNCGGAEIMPLNTDLDAVRTAVRRLRTYTFGSQTYSSAGLAWATRVLASSWRDVWGDSVHPMDESTGVTKVIVLLTDGEDNYMNDYRTHRRQGCTAAKDEGITIFTIAAMAPRRVAGSLARELKECSSQADNPDGTYSFVNNATPGALKKAFADIGRQLITVRRTY